MDRKRGHGRAIGLLLSLAALSAAMTLITLGGFSSSNGGDIAVSASSSPLNMALIAAGALALIGLEIWHIAGRRAVTPRLLRQEAARI